MKLFVDTHILADYFLDRSDNVRPLGKFTFQLLKRTVGCEFYIVVSDEMIKELEKILNKKKDYLLRIILKEIIDAGKAVFVSASESQIALAEKLARERHIPRSDALFAILAKDNGAVLVSRDKHHRAVKDIVEVLKPEEL